MTEENLAGLGWGKMDGLLPAIVQDSRTLQVLMLGYMSPEALRATLASGRVTFHSRSRGRLWTKGEVSGNGLRVVRVEADCDGDALLVFATPAGPTCHRLTASCFGGERAGGIGFLPYLEQVVAERREKAPAGSYTAKLFASGIDRIAQKVGEEAVEVVIASKNEDPGALRGEAADLLFHLLVLLCEKRVDLGEIVETLRARHAS